jgi:hypothetical protein
MLATGSIPSGPIPMRSAPPAIAGANVFG